MIYVPYLQLLILNILHVHILFDLLQMMKKMKFLKYRHTWAWGDNEWNYILLHERYITSDDEFEDLIQNNDRIRRSDWRFSL